MSVYPSAVQALYREQPVNVLFLDSDPGAAARALCDVHTASAVRHAAQLLSNAWHSVCNPQYQPLEEAEELPQAFRHWTRPPEPVKPEGPLACPDPLYRDPISYVLGYWLLWGQRIMNYEHRDHPHTIWASSSTPQYKWVFEYGVAACDEHRKRYGKPHTLEPVLWTLELPPAGMPADEFVEPPAAMPEYCVQVTEDGYVDAVASYRNYYVKEKQALLKWTGREHPDWLLKKGDLYVLAE